MSVITGSQAFRKRYGVTRATLVAVSLAQESQSLTSLLKVASAFCVRPLASVCETDIQYQGHVCPSVSTFPPKLPKDF